MRRANKEKKKTKRETKEGRYENAGEETRGYFSHFPGPVIPIAADARLSTNVRNIFSACVIGMSSLPRQEQ